MNAAGTAYQINIVSPELPCDEGPSKMWLRDQVDDQHCCLVRAIVRRLFLFTAVALCTMQLDTGWLGAALAQESSLLLSRTEVLPPPGEGFRDCPECPEMIVVPAGHFVMGSPPPPSDSGWTVESPPHLVTIAHPLAVGKYPITFDEWDACVAGGGCGGYSPPDHGWGRYHHPVIGVNLEDAERYIRWLNAQPEHSAPAIPGGPYRILSEAEYEYVARASTTTTYYWGPLIGIGHANCDGCGSQWDNKETAPVGSFPPNAFGLYDTVSNVAEWTADCWHEGYKGAPDDGRPWRYDNCTADWQVIRGASWDEPWGRLRSSSRGAIPKAMRTRFGFRVARTLDAIPPH